MLIILDRGMGHTTVAVKSILISWIYYIVLYGHRTCSKVRSCKVGFGWDGICGQNMKCTYSILPVLRDS